jgi:alpha/beta superfamily hydrolase
MTALALALPWFVSSFAEYIGWFQPTVTTFGSPEPLSVEVVVSSPDGVVSLGVGVEHAESASEAPSTTASGAAHFLIFNFPP